MNHLQIAKNIAGVNEILINKRKPMSEEVTNAGILNARLQEQNARQVKELNALKEKANEYKG